MIPICQDTGMAVVFIEVGQEVHFKVEVLRMPSMRVCARDMWKDTKVCCR